MLILALPSIRVGSASIKRIIPCMVAARLITLSFKPFAKKAESSLNRIRKLQSSSNLYNSRIANPRSIVASKLGGKEKLLRVEGAQMRRYEERFALLNEQSGNWYAPVVYPRNIASGEPIEIGGCLVVITNPLNLRLYLENWTQIGYEVNNYEVVSVLTDVEFDDFVGWAEAEDKPIVVDPIFNGDDPAQLARGFFIKSSGRVPGDKT
jgi:hypothetical protein